MTQSIPKTQSWVGDLPGTLRMIDQTRLPEEFVEIDCESVEQVWEAIKRLSVRGGSGDWSFGRVRNSDRAAARD